MKKLIVVLLMVSLTLAGCSLWMDGSYKHVVPHLHAHQSPGKEKLAVGTYEELEDAILALVEDGTAKSVIFLQEEIRDQAQTLVPRAIRKVQRESAIGAYALSDVQYDIGTRNGVPALALEFTYRHGRPEILRIKHAGTMEEAVSIIETALDGFQAGVVISVDDYAEQDLTQLVRDYADQTPWSCMETPQVAEMVYPDAGQQRIIELSFTYQNSRDALRGMQQEVKPVFSSAELYVQGDAANMEKFSQLYSFLMERYEYSFETSITPSYSLLCHGVGDAKAFANVYAAMCRRAGLKCDTVSGTREGQPWYWNIIEDGEKHYHVDLIRCSQSGGFVPKQDSEMDGYVWDYSAFPAEKEQNPVN